jgi:PIN domain nuclease of toxin-antitoxin system
MPRAETGTAPEAFILDTHVWIWLMEGTSGELSNAAVALIEEAANGSRLVVSAISVWEVAMLEAKGRITLSRSIHEWMNEALTASGLRVAELSPAIALESARLPGEPHGDLADRIIIATARVLGATLITCDERILDYGKSGHLQVRSGRSR